MKSVSRAIMLFLFLSDFFCSSASANPMQYSLDPSSSRVKFELQSDLMQLGGQFTQFSGSASIDGLDIRTLRLQLNVTPTRVKFDLSPSLQMFSPEDLVAQMPANPVVFRSTSVEPLNNGKVKVAGVIERRGKQEPYTVVAGIDLRSHELSVSSQVSGDLVNKSDPIFSVLSGAKQGSVDLKLRFRQVAFQKK